jgi:tripartite-type tricarboxylate transporter receptor subunit TctC
LGALLGGAIIDSANAGASGPIFQVVQKMFELRTGTAFQYIAYRANSEAMISLMRGDILMSLSDTGPATGPLQDGRVRALAVSSSKRLPSYPDVPTMAEAGVKDMEVEFWQGLVAPAGLPPAIVNRLNAEVTGVLKEPAVMARLRALGNEPKPTTPDEFKARMAADIAKWTAVVDGGSFERI